MQSLTNNNTVNPLVLAVAVPLTQHPAAVYLSLLGEGSRSTMRQSLNVIASMLTNGKCDHLTLNWAALRYEHTAAIQVALLDRYESTTGRKMMCALRRVLKEARKLRLISEEDYETAVDLPPIKISKSLRGRALSADEIAALMNVCQKVGEKEAGFAIAQRDLALIAILRGTGIRRAEVVCLEIKDFDSKTGSLEIWHGKGNKDRTVYLPHDAISLVENWLAIRGNKPGFLLYPIIKTGKIQLRRMTPQAVLLILQKRAKQAGIKSFSPHDFRRTFCSDLLDAGVDIVTVQKLAGHASPVTTAKYDRRGEEVKQRAVQNLNMGTKSKG